MNVKIIVSKHAVDRYIERVETVSVNDAFTTIVNITKQWNEKEVRKICKLLKTARMRVGDYVYILKLDRHKLMLVTIRKAKY